MKKHIKFKHIIVGCMMAAILAVPVMAFAAPNASDAAAADTPAVTEQAPDIADSETIPEGTLVTARQIDGVKLIVSAMEKETIK